MLRASPSPAWSSTAPRGCACTERRLTGGRLATHLGEGSVADCPVIRFSVPSLEHAGVSWVCRVRCVDRALGSWDSDKNIPCFSQRGYQSDGNVFQGDVTDYAFATAAPGLEGSTGVDVHGAGVTGSAGLRNPDTALNPGSAPDFNLAAPGFTLVADAAAAGRSTAVPIKNLPTVGTRSPDANPLPGLWSEITAPRAISAADFYGSTVPTMPRAPGADTAPLAVSSPNRGSTLPAGYVTFTGHGRPGAATEIKGAVRVVATTLVDEDGSWDATSNFTLDGDYNLTVRQTAGGIDTETTVPFRAHS